MCIVDMNEKRRLLMNENHSTSYINTQVTIKYRRLRKNY